MAAFSPADKAVDGLDESCSAGEGVESILATLLEGVGDKDKLVMDFVSWESCVDKLSVLDFW